MNHREPQFESFLLDHGFEHETDWSYHGSRFVAKDSGSNKYVTWYGGPYAAGEIILGIGNVPFEWPVSSRLSSDNKWRTAQSPLIHQTVESFLNGECDQQQVDVVLRWLRDTGLSWLENPQKHDSDDWAKKLLFMPETWDRYQTRPQLNQPESQD